MAKSNAAEMAGSHSITLASEPGAASSEDPRHEACDEVLDTTELLEAILSELSMFQLFTVQRTSKTSQATIDGSVRLQRKMLIKSAFPTQSQMAKSRVPRFNPLLFDSIFIPRQVLERGQMEGLTLQNCDLTERRPIMEFEIMKYTKTFPKYFRSPPKHLYRLPISQNERPPPSWRRMLAIDPPFTFVDADLNWRPRVFWPQPLGNGEQDATMGPLMDALDEDFDIERRGPRGSDRERVHKTEQQTYDQYWVDLKQNY